MNSFTGGLLPGAYWKADSGKPWMLYGHGKPSLFVGLILFACAHCICLSKDVFLAQQRLRLLGELQVTQTAPALAVDREDGEWGPLAGHCLCSPSPPRGKLWLGNQGCGMPIVLLTWEAGPPPGCDRWGRGHGGAGNRGFCFFCTVGKQRISWCRGG